MRRMQKELHLGDEPLLLVVHPQGSKDPHERVLGTNYYNINGIWALKPCHLGPWTSGNWQGMERNLTSMDFSTVLGG